MQTSVTVEVVSMKQSERDFLTAAVRKWAENHDISPADFARVTDYSYNHSYQVLRGKLQASSETIGKILLTYGVGSAIEIWEIMDLLSNGESTPVNPHISPED